MREEDLSDLLDQANLTIKQIDLVILCNLHNMDSPDIPFTFGSNLKDTWFDFWVHGGNLNKVQIRNTILPCLLNPPHHLTHCSLVYLTSSFNSAVIFSWDPVGFGAYYAERNKLFPIELNLPFNASWNYTVVSENLFQTGLFGAGKVMGLAPYGATNPLVKNEDYLEFADIKNLFEQSDKNAIWVEEGETRLNAKLAYNVQRLMEEQLVLILDRLYEFCLEKKIEPNLCISGGGALNSVANQIAYKRSKFKNIFLHPACGDDGTAIGAALWYWHDKLGHPKQTFANSEIMYSIKNYDHKVAEILSMEVYKDKIKVINDHKYIETTAKLISQGNIIGWYQGASELGPRALGNRSILADPRNPEMKDILNSKVKFREKFRPFAPSVLNEYAFEWFGLEDSPFMLRVCNILKPGLPAITHIDNTARIQTVTKTDNSTYYKLLQSFHAITQTPLLIDTSFNIKGEPIVETPEDAINCFLNTDIDYLIFPGKIVEKVNRN
ncbi:MAG: carbamoyltransferase C-terminal domain-containing protein [Bacteroidota bacterium]